MSYLHELALIGSNHNYRILAICTRVHFSPKYGFHLLASSDSIQTNKAARGK